MKNWIFLALIFLSACSTPKPAQIVIKPMPATRVPSDQTESIRYPEAVKPYSLGRYVEPNNPGMLHEEHTVYRIEATPVWNLHPGANDWMPFASTNKAYAPVPVNDEVIAEVNRQKTITQHLSQETGKLNSSLQSLHEALETTQLLIQQNQQLRVQLCQAEKRIEMLEKTLERWQPPSSVNPPNTNKVSSLPEWECEEQKTP